MSQFLVIFCSPGEDAKDLINAAIEARQFSYRCGFLLERTIILLVKNSFEKNSMAEFEYLFLKY